MKTTHHTAHLSLSLSLAAALAGCAEARLRDLGTTYADQTASAGDTDLGEPSPCGPLSVPLTPDDVTRAVAADLAAAPSQDRAFLRYASLASTLNAASCESALDLPRSALSKLLNSVSREPALAAPAVVTDDGTLLRLDLRDYGLAREVALNGSTHRDGWEAIVASSRYAIEPAGEQGAFITGETGTAVPWLDATTLVSSAAEGDVYYALVGMPATLGEIRASLGLPSALDPTEHGAVRAATSRSRVLRSQGNLRTLDRYAIAGGSYWEATQIPTTGLLTDPLHAQPDAQRLLIFSLPNQLLAFAVTDADGNLRSAAELVLDTNRDDFTATLLASCTNCHAGGLIPAVDELGPAVLSNPALFEPEVVAAYERGPSAAERSELAELDSAAYAAALARLGTARDRADPISSVYLGAALELSLTAAAAELMVSQDVLESRLRELPAELLPLGVGLGISREQFGRAYARAFCTLHADADNPPSARSCE